MVVRIRPINDFEQVHKEDMIIFSKENSLTVDGKNQIRKFVFDHVFEPFSSQEDVFNNCGIKRLVNLATEGYVS